jgi:hypothetical protein
LSQHGRRGRWPGEPSRSLLASIDMRRHSWHGEQVAAAIDIEG